MPSTEPPSSERELTPKAILLGLLLAFVFGAANAYLGMKAGQTVAATIPAAVIAMTLFRIPAMRGGLLEMNIARTAGSVGEALVSGAIFVIPSFLMVDLDGHPLWADLRQHYWQASMLLVTGGMLGVLFTVLIRRPLFADKSLPWPESVASVEVLRAGVAEGQTDAPRLIFGSMAFAGLIQALKDSKGLQIFQDSLSGYLRFPRSSIQYSASSAPVQHAGGISWSTPGLSPALIGIGYIIGPKLASVNLAGGLLAWWILIPLIQFFDPAHSGADDALTVWRNVVRPIAVGAMLISAGHTLFSMRESLLESVRGALRSGAAAAEVDARERDLPFRGVIAGIFALLVPITSIYFAFTHGWTAAIGAAIVMTVSGFFLSAVGGYLVGLVGVSNQPLSGLTLGATGRNHHRQGGRRNLCRRRLWQPPRHRIRRLDRCLQADRALTASRRTTTSRRRTIRRHRRREVANPVHCVKLSNDGLLYVCDRINDRIQVFRKDGTFVKEWFYEKNTLGNGAVWDIAIWPDPKQTWLLSADGENNEIRILNREDGTVVGSFGHNGRNAGQFHWIHAMAVDQKVTSILPRSIPENASRNSSSCRIY